LAVGNGLRGDIWLKFQERFAIPIIGEFYAATEGNANLVNFTGKPGAVGFMPRVLDKLYTVKLLRYDVENDELIRDANGFCIECPIGEPGHAVGKIVEGDPATTFKGYTNKEATEKKILRNAFTKGDAWFMTGDLLKRDESGFYYFVDRIGDTFRWKGENVATSEVEIVVRAYPGVREVTVYGVQVPRAGGRAGMAVIVPNGTLEEFDFPQFYKYTKEQLPSYSIPIFLRFEKEIEITGTFKHKKADLRQQGFNPALITEPLYIRDPTTESYIPLTPEMFAQIQASSISSKL
jgi:fatty-acyl-CoA synthase